MLHATHDKRELPEPDRVEPGRFSALLQELVRENQPASVAAAPERLAPGAVLGRFELLRELGRGGFGVVFEARDRELGRQVAVKVLRATSRPDAAVAGARLLAEAEVAARLSHPNIVALHDVGRSEHGPYLVLELLRGSSLASRLRHGPLPVVEALRIAIEVAKGLAHAHGHGVVHRDLTPNNVFLCDDGQVKVLDFGMAHAFGRKKLEGGTRAYMAPEQARGAPEDERTDVFALGVILYQMLTNETPFPDAGRRPAQGSRSVPVLNVAGVPAAGTLLARLLEKDPVKRPRDGTEVLSALAACQVELERAPAVNDVVKVYRPERARGRPRTRPGRSRRATSLAVLPFVNMSADPEQEYFSDGLSEEIIIALAHVEGLRVTGRTSSFCFKGANEDLRSIGQKLRVRAVLEGSVRKSGTRVRIAAQVINVADGYQLWARSFDRELTDIFAVQEEIAREVVAALQVKLVAGREPATMHRTTNPDVYSHYLLGRQLFRHGSEEEIGRAVRAYENALALEGSYAPAWAGLAIARLHHETARDTAPADIVEQKKRALAEAETAVRLAPNLADGFAARAVLRMVVLRDWTGAESDLGRAIALNPGDPENHHWYGRLLASLNRLPEAIAALRRATDLDPLSAFSWNTFGWIYIGNGQIDLARQALNRALEIAPDNASASGNLAVALILDGQPAEALATVERYTGDEVHRLVAMALAHHELGHPRESQQALDALVEKHAPAAACQLAAIHAWRDEPEQAFAWLDQAYAHLDGGLLIVEFDPLLCNLRRDPRFAALLRRMNLPTQ